MSEASFAERIRRLREKKGLAKSEVAKAIGVSSTAYYFYELGRHRPSKAELYESLADALNCEVSYLTFDDERLAGMEEKNNREVNTGEMVSGSELTLGQKLKRLREEKNLSRDEVAELAGIAHSTYGKYESDNNLPLHDEAYDRLAEVLGCDAGYLRDGADQAFSELHDSKKELGHRLRSLREKEGMGLKEFAERIGIPSSTLSNYETGYSRPKDIGLYDSFAESLGVDAGIFKELDPRCEEYESREELVDLGGSGWETVTGVYSDDDGPEISDDATEPENTDDGNDDALTGQPLEEKPEAVHVVSISDGEADVTETPAAEGDRSAAADEVSVNDIADPGSFHSLVDYFQAVVADKGSETGGITPETIRIVSRISVLLAGNRLSKAEKDSIVLSVLSAYEEGLR